MSTVATLSPLEEAIAKAGNQIKLAELLTKAAKVLPKGSPLRGRKFKQQNISWWLHESDGVVPLEVAPLFELAVEIPRQRMRPDFFGAAA